MCNCVHTIWGVKLTKYTQYGLCLSSNHTLWFNYLTSRVVVCEMVVITMLQPHCYLNLITDLNHILQNEGISCVDHNENKTVTGL